MNTRDNLTLLDADPRFEFRLLDRSMEEAFRILNEADREAQIFTYDVNQVPFYQFRSADERLRFTLELNETRSKRPRNPPGCPVCLAEIKRNKTQHWFAFRLFDQVLVALANPYAFMPMHTTIASIAHEAQSWRTAHSGDTRQGMEQVLRDVYALATALPKFVLIFNENSSSGASLPRHRHYQAFELPKAHGPLAIQQAAARSFAGQTPPIVSLGFQGEYPACGGRFSGSGEAVVSAAADFLEQWDRLLGESATANLIAVTENDQVCIYVVLRHALFRHAPGFAGILGALEMAGSFVLSSDWELQSVREGLVSFDTLWGMLASVCPPEARQLALPG